MALSVQLWLHGPGPGPGPGCGPFRSALGPFSLYLITLYFYYLL